MRCMCIGPSTRHEEIQSEGRAVKIFKAQQEYDDFGDRLPKTVVLSGNVSTIITLGDPIPQEWYDQCNAVKERASSIFSDITSTIAKVAKPVTEYLDERAYWSKVREYTDPSFVWPDDSSSPYTCVRTPEAVKRMVAQLVSLPRDHPHIGIDMEAFNLEHQSGLCLLQIRDDVRKQTFLVDLLVLQEDAFNIRGINTPQSLRGILEDPYVPKLIFDVRQDSCALYAQADIRLRGMVDLQIMFMLASYRPSPYWTGMKTVCKRILPSVLECTAFAQWLEGKEVEYPADKGIRVWQQRLLPAKFQRYAAGDVEVLGLLYQQLFPILSPDRRRNVLAWTIVEVEKTWCTAEEWESSGSKITPGFESCFEDAYSRVGSVRVLDITVGVRKYQ